MRYDPQRIDWMDENIILKYIKLTNNTKMVGDKKLKLDHFNHAVCFF